MARETTNKRKRRKSARARQKQRLMLLFAMIAVLLLLGIVAGVHFYQQWEKRFESNTSVVFIQKNGTVVTNDVVAFDTDKYSKSELELFIEETLRTYNKENGEDSVVQESFEVENKIASLILTYTDVDTYEKFSGTELFVGSITEAVAAGYKFDSDFARIVDGNAIKTTVDKFIGQTDLKVAIIKANTKIQVEGEILYLSAENVDRFGENWVITHDGANLLGTGNLDAGQSTETENETGTDTEQSDGSVDGTELVTEEESTEIIFDFGDEEVSPEEDTYSEVYTYIIYK